MEESCADCFRQHHHQVTETWTLRRCGYLTHLRRKDVDLELKRMDDSSQPFGRAECEWMEFMRLCRRSIPIIDAKTNYHFGADKTLVCVRGMREGGGVKSWGGSPTDLFRQVVQVDFKHLQKTVLCIRWPTLLITCSTLILVNVCWCWLHCR